MDFVITISGCSLGRQSLIGYLREKLRENLIERTARRRAISSFRIDSRAALFLGCPLALLPGVLEFGPGAGVVRPRCGSGGRSTEAICANGILRRGKIENCRQGRVKDSFSGYITPLTMRAPITNVFDTAA
jgi:hypothetical protein